jgi:hypothetical protein
MEEDSMQERNHSAKVTISSGACAMILQCFVMEAQPTQLQARGFNPEEFIYGDLFSKDHEKWIWVFFSGHEAGWGESHAFSHEISPLNLDSKMLIFYYDIWLGFIIKDMDF